MTNEKNNITNANSYFSHNNTFGTSCNGPVKKDLPKEKEHPKLIKNIGNGNLSCVMQDKVGNLWFGTSNDGLYKYDGKLFSQFLVTDGLSSNDVYCLLEDKDGKIWVGTRGEGLYLFDGKTFINYTEYKH